MGAAGAVPETSERASGEGDVEASTECEPRGSSYQLLVRSMYHFLYFVFRRGATGEGSSWCERGRYSGRVGEVESDEDGVDERLLRY